MEVEASVLVAFTWVGKACRKMAVASSAASMVVAGGVDGVAAAGKLDGSVAGGRVGVLSEAPFGAGCGGLARVSPGLMGLTCASPAPGRPMVEGA